MNEQQQVIGDLKWDGLRRPRIYYAMAALFMGLFLAVIDGTICNVALPAIAAQLQVSSSDSIWVVNAFQLVVMMTLLPFSTLGELYGYKRIYLYGILVFTLGSLFCTLSSSLFLLVSSRMFQGVGAGMIMSVNGSLVKLIYPKRHLGKGFGLNATVVAMSSMAGPALSGVILSLGPWPWLFAINIPVGVITWWMSRKYLPANPTRVLGRRFDWRSAVLNIATFGLLIGGVEAASQGASTLHLVVGGVILVLVATVFVRRQLGQSYPMLPFDLLRIPIFSISVITSIFSFTAQMLGMVALPFLLHDVYHFNVVETGLIMTSWPLVIVFVAPIAGMLVGRVHCGILGGVGLFIMSIGCFLLANIPQDADYWGFIWRMMLCGAGFGLFQSPNNHLLLSSAPVHRSGSASGMLATARLAGQTTGAALVALMFHLYAGDAVYQAMLLAGGITLAGAFTSGIRLKAGK